MDTNQLLPLGKRCGVHRSVCPLNREIELGGLLTAHVNVGNARGIRAPRTGRAGRGIGGIVGGLNHQLVAGHQGTPGRVRVGEECRRSDHVGVQDDSSRVSVAELPGVVGRRVVEPNSITGSSHGLSAHQVVDGDLDDVPIRGISRQLDFAQSDGARAVATGDIQRGHDDRFVILAGGSLAGRQDSQNGQHTAEACPPKNRLHAHKPPCMTE